MTPSSVSSTPTAGVSLSAYLSQASERLDQSGVSFGHGTANAHDEAAWLVLWGLGLPLDTDTTEHATALTPEQCQRLDALIDQPCLDFGGAQRPFRGPIFHGLGGFVLLASGGCPIPH